MRKTVLATIKVTAGIFIILLFFLTYNFLKPHPSCQSIQQIINDEKLKKNNNLREENKISALEQNLQEVKVGESIYSIYDKIPYPDKIEVSYPPTVIIIFPGTMCNGFIYIYYKSKVKIYFDEYGNIKEKLRI